jgi:hypothetical protein
MYGVEVRSIQDFSGKTLEKETTWRPRHMWKDYFKILKKWDRRVVVNLQNPLNVGNFLTSWGTFSSPRRTLLYGVSVWKDVIPCKVVPTKLHCLTSQKFITCTKSSYHKILLVQITQDETGVKYSGLLDYLHWPKFSQVIFVTAPILGLHN